MNRLTIHLEKPTPFRWLGMSTVGFLVSTSA
jgi:hypothetical protein